MNKTMNDYIKQYNLKENNNYYYVYIHRRASDNSIFYVGKGCSSRAWNSHNRNKYWNNISNKHGIVVEIFYDNLSEDDSLSLECKTIKQFIDSGIHLSNFTSGGDNPVFNEESRQKMSASRKNKPLSEAHKRALSISKTGKPRPDISGENNGLFDDKKYGFINIVTEEILYCTRDELSLISNVDRDQIKGLFTSRRRKSSFGWARFDFCNDINFVIKRATTHSSLSTTKQSVFIHKDGTEFVGTRKDLADKYSIKLELIHALFCKNPRPSTNGWRLKELNATTN